MNVNTAIYIIIMIYAFSDIVTYITESDGNNKAFGICLNSIATITKICIIGIYKCFT